jgi:predicted amidohydrolase
MNTKVLSVIALTNRDFPNFEAKLEEAARWIALAGRQGADLVVLPEMINRYCGDGPGHPLAQPTRDVALRDWRNECATIILAATLARVALTLPVVHWETGRLHNSFFFLDRNGALIGRYDKACPTPAELDAGMLPAVSKPFNWEGICVGGALCFDTCFPEVIERQVAAGTQLILVPSLWPGGQQLNHFALQHSVRFAVAYPAWSRIIDLDGRDVIAGGYRHETLRFGFGTPVYTARLNFGRVALFGNHNQEKIAALAQHYGDRVRIVFDQENCQFFLESVDPQLAERDVIEKFGLISTQDYFSDCARRLAAARMSPE